MTQNKTIHWQTMHWWQRAVVFAAMGFGSGLLPKAPGTWGSLVVLLCSPLYITLNSTQFLVLCVLTVVLGIVLCHLAARILGIHDDSRIVWDEFAGQLIAFSPLWFFPHLIYDGRWVWGYLGIGFLVFRVFDVIKPWPIRHVDRTVHGGVGIMFDDVMAGLFSAITLAAFMFAVSSWVNMAAGG